MTTDNIIKALKSGELDAGIISTPYTAANEFYHDFLFNEELMLYTAEESEEQKAYSSTRIDSSESVCPLSDISRSGLRDEEIAAILEQSDDELVIAHVGEVTTDIEVTERSESETEEVLKKQILMSRVIPSARRN